MLMLCHFVKSASSMITIYEAKIGLLIWSKIKKILPNVGPHFNYYGSMATLIGNANVW